VRALAFTLPSPIRSGRPCLLWRMRMCVRQCPCVAWVCVYVPVFTFTHSLSLSHCLWAACTNNMGRGGLPDGCGWGWGVQLEVSADGQTLTGRVVGDIVDGRAKAATLARLAAEHGVERAQVRPSLGAKHMCRVVYSFSVSLCVCVYAAFCGRCWRWAMALMIYR
jgi:hypothetical protein